MLPSQADEANTNPKVTVISPLTPLVLLTKRIFKSNNVKRAINVFKDDPEYRLVTEWDGSLIIMLDDYVGVLRTNAA